MNPNLKRLENLQDMGAVLCKSLHAVPRRSAPTGNACKPFLFRR